MIAFAKKGKPRGDNSGRPTAVKIPGAASSAASAALRVGVKEKNPNMWLYVPGEGYVQWKDLHAQVDRAYEAWRHKKAEQGIIIADREEMRQADINRRRPQDKARIAYLREWRSRHIALCLLADIAEERCA